jgi:hypothetical protein
MADMAAEEKSQGKLTFRREEEGVKYGQAAILREKGP